MARSGFWKFDRERLLRHLFTHGPRRFAILIILISNAAVKRFTLKHAAGEIELRRGEVAFSQRQLARDLGEPLAAVHRDVHRLEAAGQITLREVKRQTKREVKRLANREVRHPLTVATIADYEVYAFPLSAVETGQEAESETATETQSETKERRTKKEELRKNGNQKPF